MAMRFNSAPRPESSLPTRREWPLGDIGLRRRRNLSCGSMKAHAAPLVRGCLVPDTPAAERPALHDVWVVRGFKSCTGTRAGVAPGPQETLSSRLHKDANSGPTGRYAIQSRSGRAFLVLGSKARKRCYQACHCARCVGAASCTDQRITSPPGQTITLGNLSVGRPTYPTLLTQMVMTGLSVSPKAYTRKTPALRSISRPVSMSAVAIATRPATVGRRGISFTSRCAPTTACNGLTPSWTALLPHGGQTFNATDRMPPICMGYCDGSRQERQSSEARRAR